MDRNGILYELIQQNNGYLLTSMATERGISKPYLGKYVKENNMEKAARGIYIAEDVWPDELYIMQARNNAVVFPVKQLYIFITYWIGNTQIFVLRFQEVTTQPT